MKTFEKIGIVEKIVNQFFLFVYGFVKYIPVPIGYILRIAVLKLFGLKGGLGWIHDGVTIVYPWRVKLGKGWSLNERVCIIPGGLITIKDNTRISNGVNIISANHNFDNVNIPIKYQGFYNEDVLIEDDVWIGANATILPGLRIGKGCIIGSGSIVNKSFTDYTIIAGNPAVEIKKRSN